MNKEFLDKVIEWLYKDTGGEWNGDMSFGNKVNGFPVTQHIRQYIQGIEHKASITTWVKFPFITEPLIRDWEWRGGRKRSRQGRDVKYLFDKAFKEYCYNNYALQQEEFNYVYLHYLKKLHRLHSIDVIRLEEQILLMDTGESFSTHLRYR